MYYSTNIKLIDIFTSIMLSINISLILSQKKLKMIFLFISIKQIILTLLNVSQSNDQSPTDHIE